jgi:hypothetical protein
MLCTLFEHIKGRNLVVVGCGFIACVSGLLCRFPPLVLSRSGS